ncbi:MAG: hypothetical protein FWF91_07145 [Coriobacteriia bacterium]|nr:hypothetical protein [Coriobacteriia bacterium]
MAQKDCNDTLQGLVEDPERKKLRLSMQNLKEQITGVLAEYEDILLQQNPQIEADYAIKVGCHENEELKSYIAMRRAKRKYELAQARINTGEPVDEKAIEQQLDRAFTEWEEKLQATLDHYFSLIDYRNNRVAFSEADAKEFKRLFHSLVKRFHPDIHPELGEEGSTMFRRIQAAYEAGDLATLRSLETTTSGADEPDGDPLQTLDELRAGMIALEAMLSVFQVRLDKLKQRFPYRYAKQLQNPGWVTARVKEIEERIAANADAEREYRERFNSLLGGVDE